MQRQSLVAKAGRKFKATTHSNHSLPIAPNLLEQDFSCDSINEKWCGDTTISNWKGNKAIGTSNLENISQLISTDINIVDMLA